MTTEKEKRSSKIIRVGEWGKATPGEEGALGPIDSFNRFSYRISKPAFFIVGGATLFFPPLLPAGIFTGIWAGSDKLQLEGSKWIRRKLNKTGEKVNTRKAQEVYKSAPRKEKSPGQIPIFTASRPRKQRYKDLPLAA